MGYDNRFYDKASNIIYEWKKSWGMGTPKEIGSIVEEDELQMLIAKALMDEADKNKKV